MKEIIESVTKGVIGAAYEVANVLEPGSGEGLEQVSCPVAYKGSSWSSTLRIYMQ